MALSNRDRIGRMFEVLAPALDDYISSVIGQADPALGADWTKLVQAKDVKNGASPTKAYEPLDPQVQFRILTEGNITGAVKAGWYPFSAALGRAGESFAIELREVRNSWAHNGSFTDDDAYRALDTGERLLRLINANEDADSVRGVRQNLRRVTADKDDKRTLKQAVDNPESTGLRPWREVLPPARRRGHRQLRARRSSRPTCYKVGLGRCAGLLDYAEPGRRSSQRTYLTEGLRDLIGSCGAAPHGRRQRPTRDQPADKLRRRQDALDAGSLWHLAAGESLDRRLPSRDARPPRQESGYQQSGAKVAARARSSAITSRPSGTSESRRHTGSIRCGASWPGSSAEPRHTSIVANVRCGSALTRGRRCMHAARAHTLAGRHPRSTNGSRTRATWSAGTTSPAAPSTPQFTFAQSLTEAAKGTRGVLLCISIPASDERRRQRRRRWLGVGGWRRQHGLEALKRLQNVVRRVADQWRPASSDEESYHIVQAATLQAARCGRRSAAIGGTARAYRRDVSDPLGADFPTRGARTLHTRTGSGRPIRSTPRCSTGCTRAGPRWSGSNAPGACCG
jgi:hypothetical protein